MDGSADTPTPTPIQILRAVFKKRPALLIPVVFFLALIIRLLFLPNKGFEADISFWKSWGLAVYDHGIVWGIENTNNNYPTAFAYVLGLMTWVYSLFADPHNFYEYWNNNNLLFLTISKLPSVLADFGIAGIILWIGKNAKKVHFPLLPFSFYALLSFIYLLNPITIIDGAWWGQVDSVGVFVFFVAFLLAVRRMPFLAGFVYMASMMTKLQNMIYGPVFFLFLWQFNGFSGLVKGVAGTMTAFLGLNFEFFLARKMGLVFESLTANYDYFPFLSLNAYNLWWIVAKANGMHTLDKFSTIGMTNAKSVGLYIFSSLYLIAIVLMIKETLAKMFKKSIDPTAIADPQTILYRFFTALMLVAGGFFLFQTESHDRYAFPMILFFPMWATFFVATALSKTQRLDPYRTKVFKVIGIFYLLFSIFYFYNVHTALVDNYPQNGLPLLKELIHPVFTIGDSFILLFLFGAYLWAITRHVSATWYIIPVLSFAALVGLQNLPLLTKAPVSINAFKPIISQQGYGSRQVDMPVNAFNGFNSWGTLSVQYAFYRHGIGTHTKSYQMYHVNRMFRFFSVDVGIDTEAGPKGTASFEVYGDDKLLFKYDKLGRYDYPKHMNIDITGVTRLGLVTNDAGDGINDDHTDWLNPQLWP